jgi:hypothetical protein
VIGVGDEQRPAASARAGDALLTAEREEVKFLLRRERIQAFATAMARHLPHHRFTGEGANPLPRPRHFVTTVYFDTESRHQYRAARANSGWNVKLRAKEYYDLHPSLAELATDPRQIVKFQPVLWLELKSKDGERTSKRRIGIPKRQIPGFLGQGAITPEMIELGRAAGDGDGEAVLREIADYCARYDQPLRADCLVNYRRMPWQDAEGLLRVTLDVGLELYAPPADLWQRDHALVRETLGAPKGRVDHGIVEIKARGEHPRWLTELLDEMGAERERWSKFEQASAAVHGTQA